MLVVIEVSASARSDATVTADKILNHFAGEHTKIIQYLLASTVYIYI